MISDVPFRGNENIYKFLQSLNGFPTMPMEKLKSGTREGFKKEFQAEAVNNG